MVRERKNPLLVSKARYSQLIHLRRYEIAHRYARGRLLDIACGVGYGAALLNSHGQIQYIGVDVDIASIESAKLKYGCFGEFAVVDGNSHLPFASQSFNTVCSLETIEHLERTRHAGFYSELLRVLKSGGLLIISTPNKDWKTKQALRKSGWHNPYHKYEFNPAEFEGFVRNVAPYPVRVCRKYYLGFAYNLTGVIYPHVLTRWMKRWIPQFVLRNIDRVEITLGSLTPGHCNSLCFIVKKL